jgi:hypothetical protein
MRQAAKAIALVSAALGLALAGCSQENPRVTSRLNDEATLNLSGSGLAVNPLQWKVITSAIDHRDGTMYTVFGNDPAVASARTHAQHDYPAGSVIALVTWTQQEDPRWFGGNIPKAPKSVEMVTVGVGDGGKLSYKYEVYEGLPLKRTAVLVGAAPEGRAAYLVAQRAAVMP